MAKGEYANKHTTVNKENLHLTEKPGRTATETNHHQLTLLPACYEQFLVSYMHYRKLPP